MDTSATNPLTPLLLRPEQRPPLHLAMRLGQDFGWGVCATHLAEELRQQWPLQIVMDPNEEQIVEGVMLHQCGGSALAPSFRARGAINIGYAFAEFPLAPGAKEVAKSLDLMIGGSTFCRDHLRQSGFAGAEVLIQGIDPKRFPPTPPAPREGPFVIYSGGKFEFRKGQDIVLAACRELMKRHADILLIANWGNLWPSTMASLALSPHIPYRHDESLSAKAAIERVIREMGLPAEQILVLDVLPQSELPSIFAKSHVGVFPNRCEGGTNLVLMEYMAAGRPAIATYATGQRDVLDDSYALPLCVQTERHLPGEGGMPGLPWAEQSVEELVMTLEYAYHHRADLEVLGARAAAAMRERFTWRHSAERLTEILDSVCARDGLRPPMAGLASP